MKEKIEALNALIAAMKQDFEKHITDMSIPLQTRWKEWVSAPEYLKNGVSSSYCREIDKAVKKYLQTDEVCWYGDFHRERYQTVLVDQLIDTIAERHTLGDRDDTPTEYDEYFETLIFVDPRFSTLLEDLLAINKTGFIYDW